MKWAAFSKMNILNTLSAVVMLGQSQGTMALIPMEHVAAVAGVVNLLYILLRSYTREPVSWVPPAK